MIDCLLIDCNNLAMRDVHVAVKEIPEDNNKFEYWKTKYLEDIFKLVAKFNPKEVVLAYDHKNQWRKSVYPDYKAHRNKDGVINYELFYPVFVDFMEEIKLNLSSFHTIKIDGCEGDDIIAILVKKVFKDKTCVIYSSDKDMHQLLSSSVRQFDLSKNDFHESFNPQLELDIKIIAGDKSSDNIPPVKAGIGPKKGEKVLSEGLEKFLNEDLQNRVNWERNRTLISFDFIPAHIESVIINTFTDSQLKKIDNNTFIRFLSSNNMFRLIENWSMYHDAFKDF